MTEQEIAALVEKLNAPLKEDRLSALRELKQLIDSGKIPSVEKNSECNNHVHSKYSFSPYSPSMIVWKAYQNGLQTCGIMDHESVAGMDEFHKACDIMEILPTCGFEMRCNFDSTPLAGKRLNNPDQFSIAYMPVHGVPMAAVPKLSEFLAPIRAARKTRNEKMVSNINILLAPYDITIDYEKDVIPQSKYDEGGSITERHILYATGLKMMDRFGKGDVLVKFLKEDMDLDLQSNDIKHLSDPENTLYDFDLMLLLKKNFSEKIFEPSTPDESPDVRKVLPILNSLGCVPTYAYLGDVLGESVTGDKKIQKMDDDVLEDIFGLLEEIDLHAITYAPARNTRGQIDRLRSLCKKYDVFEILGEDINQPRQAFFNDRMSPEEKLFFDNSTRILVKHEAKADAEIREGRPVTFFDPHSFE